MNFVTLIGFLAGIFTTISSLPQAMKIIKTKSTEDLSLGMYIVLTVGIFLWIVYGIFLKDPPIIIANVVSIIFIFAILIMIIKYK